MRAIIINRQTQRIW